MITRDELRDIEAQLQRLPGEDFSFVSPDQRTFHEEKVKTLLTAVTKGRAVGDQKRVWAEFTGLGPLEQFMDDPEITEIIINGPDSLWLEKNGRLSRVDDSFCSDISYRNCIERLCEASRSHFTIERPAGQGNLRGFRVQIVGAELTRTTACLCLRRHPENPWTLDRLASSDWAKSQDLGILRNWIQSGKNFLVIGPTGCGKTSVVNACLQELPAHERVLILEDTQELCIPNALSQRFLTREDSQRILPDVTLADLVRQSLRMRPDRLVIGEIRGPEAKDFLLALSTGHRGSFGTLHASTPQQGLIRLEMLVQMGAPHWNLLAIRRLIQLSLKGIVVLGRDSSRRRILQGLYEISSLEDSGFLIEQISAEST